MINLIRTKKIFHKKRTLEKDEGEKCAGISTRTGRMELINPTASKLRYEEGKYEKSTESDIEESSKKTLHKRETL